jgi:hypothetical protein
MNRHMLFLAAAAVAATLGLALWARAGSAIWIAGLAGWCA